MPRKIYSRRVRDVTWNDAAARKEPKPKPPLRYRIAPWEKKLDDLDELERELNRELDAERIEWDQFEELESVINSQREAADLKRRKATGEYVKPVRERVERVAKAVKVKATYTEPQFHLTPFQFKVCLILAIFLLIAAN